MSYLDEKAYYESEMAKVAAEVGISFTGENHDELMDALAIKWHEKNPDDDWGMDKRISELKRSRNRWRSAALLVEKGVTIIEKNDGAHLIVKYGELIADFWPGTGKYKLRSSGRYLRGVFRLLKDLGVE